MQLDLNATAACEDIAAQRHLGGQVFTPRWAADLIIQRQYGWLDSPTMLSNRPVGRGSVHGPSPLQ